MALKFCYWKAWRGKHLFFQIHEVMKNDSGNGILAIFKEFGEMQLKIE